MGIWFWVWVSTQTQTQKLGFFRNECLVISVKSEINSLYKILENIFLIFVMEFRKTLTSKVLQKKFK